MKQSCQFAFSGRFPAFRNRLVSPLYVGSPDSGNPVGVKVKAVWDTGASLTVVSSRLASMLCLPSLGRTKALGAFGSSASCDKSRARLAVVLGSESIVIDVMVADMPHSDPDCDILLGLDFITLGDFALTFDGGQLMMSFTYPPLDIPVDYTQLSPRIIPGTMVDSVDDLDSDGNERFRRRLIADQYFNR